MKGMELAAVEEIVGDESPSHSLTIQSNATGRNRHPGQIALHGSKLISRETGLSVTSPPCSDATNSDRLSAISACCSSSLSSLSYAGIACSGEAPAA
jgi:hypothetical protein